MRSLGWAFIEYDWCPREGEWSDVSPSQGTSGDTRSWKRRGRILPRSFEGSRALPTPCFRTSGLQNSERIHFCCLKLPGFGNFVMATLKWTTLGGCTVTEVREVPPSRWEPHLEGIFLLSSPVLAKCPTPTLWHHIRTTASGPPSPHGLASLRDRQPGSPGVSSSTPFWVTATFPGLQLSQ